MPPSSLLLFSISPAVYLHASFSDPPFPRHRSDRVSLLAGTFRQRLSVLTLGFASTEQDFSVLDSMAKAASDAGAKGEFHRPELSSAGLSSAIASAVSSLTDTKSHLSSTLMGAPGAIVPRGGRRSLPAIREMEKESADCEHGDGWRVYTHGVRRWEYAPASLYGMERRPWHLRDLISPLANSIAIRKVPFAEGAERVVYKMQVIWFGCAEWVGMEGASGSWRKYGGYSNGAVLVLALCSGDTACTADREFEKQLQFMSWENRFALIFFTDAERLCLELEDDALVTPPIEQGFHNSHPQPFYGITHRTVPSRIIPLVDSISCVILARSKACSSLRNMQQTPCTISSACIRSYGSEYCPMLLNSPPLTCSPRSIDVSSSALKQEFDSQRRELVGDLLVAKQSKRRNHDDNEASASAAATSLAEATKLADSFNTEVHRRLWPMSDILDEGNGGFVDRRAWRIEFLRCSIYRSGHGEFYSFTWDVIFGNSWDLGLLIESF